MFSYVLFLKLLLAMTVAIQKDVQSSHAPLEISHLTGDSYIYETYQTYKGQLVPSNSMYLVTNQGVVLIHTLNLLGQHH